MNRLALAAVLVGSLNAFAQAGGSDAGYAGPDITKLALNQRSIKLVMDYHQRRVQACYEEFLAGLKKPVEGKLATSFVITADGLVKDAKVLKKGTTLTSRTLHECVVAVLGAIEFPKPKDGREQPIEYPFNLKAIK